MLRGFYRSPSLYLLVELISCVRLSRFTVIVLKGEKIIVARISDPECIKRNSMILVKYEHLY